MDGWVLWILLGVAFGVGEMLTTSFFLAPFGVGALFAALVAALGAGALGSVGDVHRRLAADAVGRAPDRALASEARRAQIRTGTAALIGRRAVVLERIANDEAVGCVKHRRRGVDGALIRR